MSKDRSAFNDMWGKIILRSIELCKRELDADFAKEAKVSVCDLVVYKKELEEIYKRKREWLKKEYLPNEEDPILDFHKLSAVMCRSMIGVKPFRFDVYTAEKKFLDIIKNKSLSQSDKIGWQIDNVYINYKLAFLVAEGIVFADLLYWAQEKINSISESYSEEDLCNNVDNVEIKIDIYNNFIDVLNSKEKRLYRYEGSDSHDNFVVSAIIALMKNDYLKRDFDYLQFSLSMFQWQEYTKKQHLYDIIKSHNIDMMLSDLV